jgi:S-adenosylmethionine hydrolase
VAGKIEGAVVAISEAGNLVTDISADQLADVPRNESVTVSCDEHETIGIFSADHQEPPMTLLAVVGSNGQLELEIVGDSAKLMLGVRVGEKVVVKW